LRGGRIKRISDEREAVLAKPPVIEVVQVELAVASVAPEIEDIQVAVRVAPRTLYRPYHRPLNTLRVESYSGSRIMLIR